MEVDRTAWGISPFASHEEWWEKPSDGFRSAIKARSCNWGVLLFVLPKREGLWIPGGDFDAQVLRGKQKVNAPDVSVARHTGVARIFHEPIEFLSFVRKPPEGAGKHFLLPKSAKKVRG